jgi:hypothetical protein
MTSELVVLGGGGGGDNCLAGFCYRCINVTLTKYLTLMENQ